MDSRGASTRTRWMLTSGGPSMRPSLAVGLLAACSSMGARRSAMAPAAKLTSTPSSTPCTSGQVIHRISPGQMIWPRGSAVPSRFRDRNHKWLSLPAVASIDPSGLKAMLWRGAWCKRRRQSTWIGRTGVRLWALPPSSTAAIAFFAEGRASKRSTPVSLPTPTNAISLFTVTGATARHVCALENARRASSCVLNTLCALLSRLSLSPHSLTVPSAPQLTMPDPSEWATKPATRPTCESTSTRTS
mmetsp:Transcript_15699/g.42595  ORF Transcript_15699/g.42595 Transcript_15699/m.42595 type:complete len:245 (-) Transcript_15699:97-831(-)